MQDPGPFLTALVIFAVIMIFNVIIFVHELGHFWAAKWRGLKIDRFQIWFGKPIWSKTINGVQYGLGWIPAGGFVALPQMAPMEAIEGDNREDSEPLPPISPLDKIIVAFAGPLFSFLLALSAAVVLWQIGKPVDTIATTTIGEVEPGFPGAEAGLQRGDKIIKVDGKPVNVWAGEIDSVVMNIATGLEDKVTFEIERPGEGRMTLTSGYKIPETEWYERRAIRQVGISPMGEAIVFVPIKAENGPAESAGMKEDDEILSINGRQFETGSEIIDLLQNNGDQPVNFKVKRRTAPDGKESSEEKVEVLEFTVIPKKPVSENEDHDRFMVGGYFLDRPPYDERWVNPSPIAQATNTLKQMWITIRSVTSPKSSIGIQHLSGPVGIGKIQFFSLLMDYPLHRILGFMVLININLAILNLLPFPVLDGGHITIATMEAIAKRPVNVRFLEVLQMGFVLILFSIMLYVSSKDIFDDFGMGKVPEREKLVFPE